MRNKHDPYGGYGVALKSLEAEIREIDKRIWFMFDTFLTIVVSSTPQIRVDADFGGRRFVPKEGIMYIPYEMFLAAEYAETAQWIVDRIKEEEVVDNVKGGR